MDAERGYILTNRYRRMSFFPASQIPADLDDVNHRLILMIYFSWIHLQDTLHAPVHLSVRPCATIMRRSMSIPYTEIQSTTLGKYRFANCVFLSVYFWEKEHEMVRSINKAAKLK